MQKGNLVRKVVEAFYDIQNSRIIVENQLRSIGDEKKKAYIDEEGAKWTEFFREEICATLKALEVTIQKRLKTWLKTQEIYTEWLVKVNGIGPILAAGLIAWLGDKDFATISKLWNYCGLSAGYVKYKCKKGHKVIAGSLPESCPVFKKKGKEVVPCGEKVELIEKVDGKIPRREKGWTLMQNQKLKVHCWKIGESFVKTGKGYRKLYERFRAEYDQKWKTPEDCGSIGCKGKKECMKGHRYNAARRKTVKIFLAHYYQVSRELKGLPVRKPFVISRLGHAEEIPVIQDKK